MKYRVFDRKNNKFLTEHMLLFPDGTIKIMFKKKDKGKQLITMGEFCCYHELEISPDIFDDYKTAIYANDIIEVSYMDKPVQRFVVSYEDCKFFCCPWGEKTRIDIHDCLSKGIKRVVGNIHNVDRV